MDNQDKPIEGSLADKCFRFLNRKHHKHIIDMVLYEGL